LTYLEKNPGDRFAMYALAMAYKNAGACVDAEPAFRRLLSVHPHSGAGHFQLGMLLVDDDREDEAVEAWRRGLAALANAADAEAVRSVREIEGMLAIYED
jgi:Tfp pilus assembly protein PilF